jgi:hypothetical protein
MKILFVPSGKFTQSQFEKINNLPNHSTWTVLQTLFKSGKVSKQFERSPKGRPAAVYSQLG